MIKAIVFDFDGTIVDTETAWYEAVREGYEEYGQTISIEMYAKCIGSDHAAFDPYTYLNTLLSEPVDLVTLRKLTAARHTEKMKKEPIRPGVLSYLEQAKEQGYLLGVASSSDRAWVEDHLARYDLRDYFSCVYTADDVERVKPDPALYRRCIDHWGIAPDEAIAIEDSSNGANAALACGMHCVVAPHGLTAHMTFDPRVKRVSDLSQLRFADMIVAFNGIQKE